MEGVGEFPCATDVLKVAIQCADWASYIESLLWHEDVFYWGEFGKSIIVPFLMLDRRFRIDFRVVQALITDNLTRNHHCDGGGALTRHGSEAWC